MIKSIYNNTKVNLQNNDPEITIIIGESGITDKCKFKDKSSTAHYYTRVLDLLAQSFIGKDTIFQSGNSKKTDVFSREKAVDNAFQYLLDLGMSLDLGHSKSYIQSISSGRALPSMSEFIVICDYLGITPQEFFDTDTSNPILTREITEKLRKFTDADLQLLLAILNRMNK